MVRSQLESARSNPEQAEIVRHIFKEYADGMAPRQIAARLNREGVPSPRGGQWNASTINGNRRRRNGILNNELYTGRITYNRQRFLKDPETGKRIARLNPEARMGDDERSLVFASSMMSFGSGCRTSSTLFLAMGQQAADEKAVALRSAQMRTLRWRHDDEQRRSLLLFGAS